MQLRNRVENPLGKGKQVHPIVSQISRFGKMKSASASAAAAASISLRIEAKPVVKHRRDRRGWGNLAEPVRESHPNQTNNHNKPIKY